MGVHNRDSLWSFTLNHRSLREWGFSNDTALRWPQGLQGPPARATNECRLNRNPQTEVGVAVRPCT